MNSLAMNLYNRFFALGLAWESHQVDVSVSIHDTYRIGRLLKVSRVYQLASKLFSPNVEHSPPWTLFFAKLMYFYVQDIEITALFARNPG